MSRSAFPSDLTYEITSADLAADWLLLQKDGERKQGKMHPSALGLAALAGATFTGIVQRNGGFYLTGAGLSTTAPIYAFEDDQNTGIGTSTAGQINLIAGGATVAAFNGTNGTARTLLPQSDNTYDLGSSTYSWRNVYIDGTTTASTILPRTDNAYDLGSPTYSWRDIYLDPEGNLWWGSSATGIGYSIADGALYFQTGYTPRCGITSGGQFGPAADATYDLGLSYLRWQDVYATNGTIQTSNQEDKADIEDSDLGLDFVLALKPKSYRWTSTRGTITTPSEAGGKATVERIPGVRRHYGLIAQDVRDSLAGKDFAGYCHDQESNFYGLRYSEFIAPLIKAVQELTRRVEELESAQSNPPKKTQAETLDVV